MTDKRGVHACSRISEFLVDGSAERNTEAHIQSGFSVSGLAPAGWATLALWHKPSAAPALNHIDGPGGPAPWACPLAGHYHPAAGGAICGALNALEVRQKEQKYEERGDKETDGHPEPPSAPLGVSHNGAQYTGKNTKDKGSRKHLTVLCRKPRPVSCRLPAKAVSRPP